MTNKPKKNDVGTMIILDMQEDVTTAIEHSEETGNGIVLIVLKPSGAVGKFLNCSLSGTEIRYITIADDLDEASEDHDDIPYKFTPKFGLSGWEGHGDTVEVYVYDTEETPG